MSKKKIPQLDESAMSSSFFQMEENSEEIFEEYMQKLDFDKASDDIPQNLDHGTSHNKTSSCYELDLHGLRLEEAISKTDELFYQKLNFHSSVFEIKVITGKGIHSGEKGSVLPREIHDHVKKIYKKNIIFLQESPAEVVIEGIPIRGHFTVKLMGVK